jgi:4-hydroxybenzoate polyprenyltransferase
VDVDRAQGLRSIPARFGTRGTFHGARFLHAATVGLLAAVGVGLHLTLAYWLGVIAVAVLLLVEHLVIRPDDLRRLDAAFFTMNGVISSVFLAFVLVEVAT